MTTCEPQSNGGSPSHGHELTLWQEGFPARTYRKLGRASVLRGLAAGFGHGWRQSLARYDPATSSWRTRQGSLTEEWAELSGSWPSWGTTRNGELFPRVPLALHTHENACSFWPTPRASDRDNCGGSNARKKAKRTGTYVGRDQNPQLAEWLMGFPTDWTALQLSVTPSSPKSPNTSDG